MKKMTYLLIIALCASVPSFCQVAAGVDSTVKRKDTTFVATGNPIIRHKYTADPAALVYRDKVYLCRTR